MKFLNFFKTTLGITILILAVIAIIVIYMNWDSIKGWFKGDSSGGRYGNSNQAPMSGACWCDQKSPHWLLGCSRCNNSDRSRSVSNAVNSELAAIQASTDLTANEKDVLTDLFVKLGSLDASDINSLSQTQRSTAMGYINEAIGKLPNARMVSGSASRTSASGYKQKCSQSCIEAGCRSSWGSGIFGFCLCWNCDLND